MIGAKDPEGVDWRSRPPRPTPGPAVTRAGRRREGGAGAPRPAPYAAAALFRLTGDRAYERQLLADTADITATTLVWDDRRFGPIVYALGGGPARPDEAAHRRIRAALLATADHAAVETPSRRAMRWGGNWYMPMLVGQQTTPWLLEGAVASTLTRAGDPARARPIWPRSTRRATTSSAATR